MFQSIRFFISSHKTHMKKFAIITGTILCMAAAFALGIRLNPDTTGVAKVNATFGPEAQSLVDSIKASGREYTSAANDQASAIKLLDDAKSRLVRSAAAGKGADLTLCAKFQARYDRATDALIVDANCPLQ